MKNYEKANEAIDNLISIRGWQPYHIPRYLVTALQVECSELLDCCLWQTPEEIDGLFMQKDPAVVSELADIAINLLSLLKYCDLDLDSIVYEKTNELIERYSILNLGEHR
ncbi:MAG: hypothetical protein NC089_06860 [Bacteroides sp.]|nr:hypothetical protein [Bacteroides sp.]MCM1548431.1 hypothetical protein [Clostridium sp.]